MKVSKRKSEVPDDTQEIDDHGETPVRGSQNEPTVGSKVAYGRLKMSLHKKRTSEEEKNNNSRPPAASVAETLNTVAQENRQRRTEKVVAAKRKGINQTVADLELVWRTRIEDSDLYGFRSTSRGRGKNGAC